VVRAREVDGSLWFVDGALCAGEIGDLSGPVEGRHALEVRLLEVAVPLLRARSAEFEIAGGGVAGYVDAFGYTGDLEASIFSCRASEGCGRGRLARFGVERDFHAGDGGAAEFVDYTAIYRLGGQGSGGEKE